MASSGITIEYATRPCLVNDEPGYFHTWEHFSKPLPASPILGGEPAGIYSRVFAIVEFKDGVRRVDPEDIVFCDASPEKRDEFKKIQEEQMKAVLKKIKEEGLGCI